MQNASKMHLTLYLYLFLHFIVGALTYSVPEPKVEILDPRGLRIWIPHEKGIALVAFHVNIDKPIGFNQPGEYAADITDPINERWIFDNTRIEVDTKTKVFYWLHVQYGNYAFRKAGSTTPSVASVDITDNTKDVPTSTSIPVVEPRLDCEPSKTTVNQRIVCKGELIFQDNFDNLNLTKWQREVRLPMGEDDAEFVSFQARDENCYVDSGQLHIVPSLLNQLPGFQTSIRKGILDLGAECTGINDRSQECGRVAQGFTILPPVVSARIRTKNFFSFRYGKVEVRAKLPKGDWLFPLILLEPKENQYGAPGYKSGQMRVAFIRGNDELEDHDGNDISGYRIAGGVVLARGAELRDVFLTGSLRRSHLGDDFHTYILTWTPNLITLEIDGNEYANFRGNFANRPNLPSHANSWKHGSFMAPFDKEFYLSLGVSVGGHSDFPDIDGQTIKPWKNTDPKAELHFWNSLSNWHRTWNGANAGLHVDYVKVYAL